MIPLCHDDMHASIDLYQLDLLKQTLGHRVITSAKEVMFLAGFVCLFENKITQKLMDRF